MQQVFASICRLAPPRAICVAWSVVVLAALDITILLSGLPGGRADGERLFLLAVGLGVLAGGVGLVRDTRDAGRAERVARDERFNELRRRLDLALEVSQIGFWDVDLDTDTLRWDARACQLMGVSARGGRFTESDWLNAVHPEDRMRAVAAAEAAIETRGQFISDYRVVWPDGDIRHLRDMAAYYVAADGRPSIAGLVWDVTDDRRREAELELRREEAETANRAKSSFLAAMSHEIRTPLAGVIGMLELMQSDDLSEEQAERARIASASAADSVAVAQRRPRSLQARSRFGTVVTGAGGHSPLCCRHR